MRSQREQSDLECELKARESIAAEKARAKHKAIELYFDSIETNYYFENFYERKVQNVHERSEKLDGAKRPRKRADSAKLEKAKQQRNVSTFGTTQ